MASSNLRDTKAKLLEANNALARAEQAFREAMPGHLSPMNTRLADKIAALERDTQIVRDRLAILASEF